MDKKNKYQQPNPKGTSIDAKKSQDVTSSKLFPKSSRRREPPSTNSCPKNEQSRKSKAQKTKNFDKRPKPKGQYHGGTKENSQVVEDESAEHGSVMKSGSKKQNMNHLLNFHFTPHDAQSGWNNRRRNGYGNPKYNGWVPAVQRHKYNKEQFLQANCQFVVTAKGDYSEYLNFPDQLVDWNLIQQIQFHTSDYLSCPICLDLPKAGKMTKCGHVYCWSCILHYLKLTDKPSKCPICYETISKLDLKSVAIIAENVLNVGDEITLRLMRREKGSLLAVPVDGTEISAPSFIPVSANTGQKIYSKLLLATDSDIIDIIELERAQLKFQLSESPAENISEHPFIEQALEELTIREKILLEVVSQSKNDVNEQLPSDDLKENQENILYREENETVVKEYFKLQNDSCNKIDCSKNNLNISYNDTEILPISPKIYYYFYQADGGQNVFLHAMNVQMLEMQYGSLEKSPRVISGKLIEKEVGSITAEWRNRTRYLSHLPVTSPIEIVEIDFQPSIVSEEVLASFEEQIARRKRTRRRRERDERKREKKITEQENKRMGKYPTPKVSIESRKHFPQFQPEIFDISTSSPSNTAASSLASSPSESSFEELASALPDVSICSSSSDHGPSFAQMLRNSSTKRAPAWPSLKTPVTEKSNTLIVESEDPANADSEMEKYAAPAYNRSLGDALAQALQQSELCQVSNSTNNAVRSKKKKKGKATVLFATNMARSS